MGEVLSWGARDGERGGSCRDGGGRAGGRGTEKGELERHREQEGKRQMVE